MPTDRDRLADALAELPYRIGDWMTVPMSAQVGGSRGTHHHARVTNVDGATVTIDARPLKWCGAPRYWWKRFQNGQPRHLRPKARSRKVHRAYMRAARAIPTMIRRQS